MAVYDAVGRDHPYDDHSRRSSYPNDGQEGAVYPNDVHSQYGAEGGTCGGLQSVVENRHSGVPRKKLE